MSRDLIQAVDFSHLLLKEHIEAGSVVLDATTGNGLDTKFMAELVGEGGHVYGFDIQEEAIEETEILLKETGLCDRVSLFCAGHEDMETYITEELTVAIFNLGFMPGGNKEIKTEKESSLKALKSAIKLIKEDGLIILVMYSGHPGGQEEKDTLMDYSESLKQEDFNVAHYHFINQKNSPGELLTIKKRIKN